MVIFLQITGARLKFAVKSYVYNVKEFIEAILRMLCLIIFMKMLMLT